MEIYENTALMWLERTQRAELVDLEVEEDKNLEVGEDKNLEVGQNKKHTIELVHLEVVEDDKNSIEAEKMEVNIGQDEVEKEVDEVKNNSNKKELERKGLKKQKNGTEVLSLEVQCAIGKVRVMINEAKEDLEEAVRRQNFVEAKTFQEQVNALQAKMAAIVTKELKKRVDQPGTASTHQTEIVQSHPLPPPSNIPTPPANIPPLTPSHFPPSTLGNISSSPPQLIPPPPSAHIFPPPTPANISSPLLANIPPSPHANISPPTPANIPPSPPANIGSPASKHLSTLPPLQFQCEICRLKVRRKEQVESYLLWFLELQINLSIFSTFF